MSEGITERRLAEINRRVAEYEGADALSGTEVQRVCHDFADQAPEIIRALLAEVKRLRAQPERDSLALELEQTLLVLEEITERGNQMKAEVNRLRSVETTLVEALEGVKRILNTSTWQSSPAWVGMMVKIDAALLLVPRDESEGE